MVEGAWFQCLGFFGLGSFVFRECFGSCVFCCVSWVFAVFVRNFKFYYGIVDLSLVRCTCFFVVFHEFSWRAQRLDGI